MRKKKVPVEVSETLAEEKSEVMGDGITDEGDGITDEGKGFFACYLLTSLSPRYKGHTYIGFTVDPKRRIRQHNGEITSGAWRTKKKRPWEMVFCIYGFPSNVTALQFEWAWQHPRESLAVREAVASNFKTLSGLANKIKVALTMITLHTWQSMELTVNFFSTKHMKHTVGCPTLPKQMKLQVCPMNDLPCYLDAAPANYPSYNKHTDGADDCWVEEVQCPQHYSHHLDEDSVDPDRNDRGELADKTSHPSAANSSTKEIADDTQSAWSLHESYHIPDHLGDFSSHSHLYNGKEGPQVDAYDLNSSLTINEGGNSVSTGESSKHVGESPSTRPVEAGESNYCWTEPDEQLTIFPHKGTRLPSGGEVEVIDLLTPDCRMNNAYGKKRRISTTASAEIIDLTRSPVFVQL